MSFTLHRPETLAEAIGLARTFGDAGSFLAGGTDLVVQMNRKAAAPAHVIDLTRIAGMRGIAEKDGAVGIGALTTHKDIESHAVFQGPLLAMAEAARVVGGHQVRNQGTIGGNIANASPAADVVVPLLALDATLLLEGRHGTRTLPLRGFMLGPGRTARASDEVIRAVHIPPVPPRSASAFLKAGRRKAMEISIVCVAARLTLGEDGRCRNAAIALGAVAPTVIRAAEAERFLDGAAATEAAFREAGRLAAAACAPIDDVRASARYRRLLVSALTARALTICRERLG